VNALNLAADISYTGIVNNIGEAPFVMNIDVDSPKQLDGNMFLVLIMARDDQEQN
jgi:hypothetical protein